MSVQIDASRRVRLCASLELPCSTEQVWERMQDFERFATLDPIHSAVRLIDSHPLQGAQITIQHRLCGVCIERSGRILRWRACEEIAFSDISRRGPHCGFPHVTIFRLTPITRSRSRWSIDVRGKWTMPLLPRWMARIWMTWILWHIVSSVQRHVLRSIAVPKTAGQMRRQSAATRRAISSRSSRSAIVRSSPASTRSRLNDSPSR